MGLASLLTREIPLGSMDVSAQRAVLRLRVATLAVFIAASWVVSWLFARETGPHALGTLAFGGAVISSDFLGAIRRAHGRYDMEVVEIGFPLVGALLVAAAAGFAGVSFNAFQLCLGAAAVLLVCVRFVAVDRALAAQDQHTEVSLASVAWKGRWFLVRGITAWAIIDVILILLKSESTAAQVAFFGAAMRPVGLVTLPFIALVHVFFPSLAHDRANSMDALRAGTRSLNIIALSAVPAGFVACAVGGKILLAMFGETYLAAAPTLMVLSVAYCVSFGLPSPAPLLVLGRERLLSLVSIGVALAIVAFGLVLVPAHGALGAAMTMVIVLSGAKVAHVLLYMTEGISFGDRRYALTLAAVAGWFVLLWQSPGWVQPALLGGGFAVSGAIAARLLFTTRVFSRH